MIHGRQRTPSARRMGRASRRPLEQEVVVCFLPLLAVVAHKVETTELPKIACELRSNISALDELLERRAVSDALHSALGRHDGLHGTLHGRNLRSGRNLRWGRLLTATLAHAVKTTTKTFWHPDQSVDRRVLPNGGAWPSLGQAFSSPRSRIAQNGRNYISAPAAALPAAALRFFSPYPEGCESVNQRQDQEPKC